MATTPPAASQPPFFLWMKQRRTELDISRTELADQVGCSLAMIRQLEQGRRRPSRQLAERLARSLQVTPDDWQRFLRAARAQIASAGPDDAELDDAEVAEEPRPQPGAGLLSPFACHGPLALPAEPLLGRERDLEAALDLIMSPEAQMLTLVGPGGVGKTRLAMQLAHRMRAAFAGQAYFIGLAGLADARQIPHAIAQGMQLLGVLAAPTPERLIAALSDRQTLLLLDNLEHLPESAPLIAALIQRCPGLKLIATSRSALHLQAERLYIVPPLSLPDPQGQPLSAALASQAPAVRLFVNRAQRVHPSFALSDANAAAVVEICRRLDGLPLAIELAAARVRALPPHAMLERLDNRLDLLVGGMQDLPARQQTLRDLLDWSYGLLNPHEQQLFRQLAVFVGGWTLAAVESICALDGEDAPPLIDTLSMLLDHSLVGERLLGDEDGFEMLGLIREYALEQLESSGDAETVRGQHAAYYLALVEQASGQLIHEQQRVWLERLEWAHDDVRAALSWLIERGDRRRALRLIGGVWRFWQFRNYQHEGLRWVDLVLDMPADGRDDLGDGVRAMCGAGWLAADCGQHQRASRLFSLAAERARRAEEWHALGMALHGVSAEAVSQGDSASAIASAEESLAIFRRLGDQEEMAWSLHHLGVALQFHGNDQTAIRLYEESLTLLRSLGHYWGQIQIMLMLAHVWIEQGEYARATALLDEALIRCHQQGYHRLTIETTRFLARAALDQGRYAQAAALCNSSLRLARSLQESNGVRWAVAHLGQIELGQGLAMRAQDMLSQAFAMTDVAQEPWAAAWLTAQLGHVAWHQGAHDLARMRYAESLRFYQQNGVRWGIPECLEGLGTLLALHAPAHDDERAALLLAGAEALRRSLRHARPMPLREIVQQALDALRQRLGADHFELIWAEGMQAPLDGAVAAALRAAIDEQPRVAAWQP